MRLSRFLIGFSLCVFVLVLSAIGGFLYEVAFYRIAEGQFLNRGSTFGPWIPIYAVGSLLILAATWRVRRKPLAVFAVSCAVTAMLEFAVGYVLLHAFGVRLWDYNLEPWNWGNVGGYICFRSYVLFGFMGLIVMYAIVPAGMKLSRLLPLPAFVAISIVPGLIFLADIIAHMALKGL